MKDCGPVIWMEVVATDGRLLMVTDIEPPKIVRLLAVDTPPPGPAVATARGKLPRFCSAAAGTVAISCESDTYVVGTEVPPMETLEIWLKFEPVTCTCVDDPIQSRLVGLTPPSSG